MKLSDFDDSLVQTTLMRVAFAFGEMCADKEKKCFDGGLELALLNAARAYYAHFKDHPSSNGAL